MSENGPVLPPEVYRRRRIVAVIALLAIILLLVAGVTSMVGMINGKKDATVASTATASGAPFQSFSARPSETASATPSASATASATATASASASVTPSVTASVAPTASATTATPVGNPDHARADSERDHCGCCCGVHRERPEGDRHPREAYLRSR